MERMTLPPRQKQVLEFIREFLGKHGYPPTIRQIGAGLGIASTNAVAEHLAALERKGAISRDRSCSRGIGLSGRRAEPLLVPIVGRIAAGVPLLAEENQEGQVSVDPMFASVRDRLFALRVTGDSMIESGIHDGDLILVRSQPTAAPGEIVVALVDGQATVKHFHPEGDRIRLQPAHPTMPPIYVTEADGRDTAVQGVVVAVFRKLA